MPGKVTITIIAKYDTTNKLEKECHEMVNYWFGSDESHVCYVVPSDDTPEEIAEEYLERD